MKLWKSVVGKLWMTIIGLVAVVLVINGVFMGQFLDTNFANSKDQERSLQKMAEKVSIDLTLHKEEFSYVNAVAELLDAQDAAMIVLDRRLEETIPASKVTQIPKLHATDLFEPERLGKVLQGGTAPAIYFDPHSGKRFLAVAVPQRENASSNVTGIVILYQAQISLDYTQAYFQNLFVIAGVIGFLLTTLFAFFLSTRITQPLIQMKKAADFITLGEYKTRVPVTGSDEIGELAVAFNQMTGRLDETINALNHEKEHLSSVLRSMTDAVITLDADGRVILTNPQGERLVEEWGTLGWAEADGDFSEEGSLAPGPLQSLFAEVVSGNKEVTSTVHVHSNVYSVVMAPLYSLEGLRGTVAVLRDVTEEHRLDKLRKDFVANVSHELRTPLSMLQGYSEALLDDIAATPEERRELAQVIHDESLRMGRLVKDLLDLARMEAGHMELNFREFDMEPLIQRVHRKFSALCKERGIVLKLTFPGTGITLRHADEDRLEQVLTNLLDNAARHTPEGAWIEIRVQAEEQDQSVLIEIVDRGRGIPREDLPYIFERFYKADKARTRGSSGGTGLGLAIVKNIVDAHQGTIHAESELGAGTTFYIKIPNRERA
ncbi:cell wall metabolism sensor histidine kinase WalK [Paenibacillus mesophilus]|uniref:ATP-binding protein n=1 Tax=Paenibacillus mesophilus TaxID=2582849 RepID=UPI00110ED66D|nr:ATP-binding protein [Paenibacillus mesophilus]TMV51325.1 cell wall metabolism sensor histidine kinase WalK [Paenibacillus mesophilus]